MDFLSIAKARQSCRKYDSDKAVEPDKLNAVLEAAQLAPSACNGQPYHFTVCRGENAREVARASTGMGMSKVTLNRWIDFNVNDGNWYHVYGGNTTQIMDVDNARVYVTGYAIQAAGIDTLSDAFALFNEQWGDPDMDFATP